MAFPTSYNQGGDESALGWVTPSDIQTLSEICPVTSKRFSIELLKMRMPYMDEETRKRAIKVISALRTGDFVRL